MQQNRRRHGCLQSRRRFGKRIPRAALCSLGNRQCRVTARRLPLVAATHNPGKARELVKLLGGRFSVTSAAELGLAEPEETETTFVGNALLKARAAAETAA